jgi:glycosyltransferase involved in cell wall biosynthesis
VRILQVTSAYYPELQFGGPPQTIHDLSRGLTERGDDVRVVTFHSEQHRLRGQQLVDGIVVDYIPWLGSGSWRIPLSRRSLAEAVRWSEIIHCYGLYNLLCPLAAFLGSRRERPFLLEPMGMAVPRARSRWAKRLYNGTLTRWMTRRAAAVVTTSAQEAVELARWVDHDRLVLRRNGIDVALFKELPPRARFRARHQIADDERLILYLGRISPIKNLLTLVRAFERANPANARLVIMGPELEADYARELRSLISSLALDGRVIIDRPGYGRCKLAALAAADLFVLPSFSENFGNAAAEAAAAGIPVLLTSTCGVA